MNGHISSMEPGVYNIVKMDVKDSNIPEILTYRLIKTSDRFNLPEVLYGDISQTAIRVWNTFALTKKSTGILLTGHSGSGKSLLGEVISNLAIAKGLPVVMVSNIKVTADTLLYLTKLNDVVIFLDEYGKNIEYRDQSKMLSFFSDTTTRKLFIITENDKYDVNAYIRNRPGRIRYHIDYTKTPKNIVLDYLNKNVSDRSVRDEILEIYYMSTVFSFDHLQAIVSEHLRYPDNTIEDIVGLLNLGILQRPYIIEAEQVELLLTHTVMDKFRIKKEVTFDNWNDYPYRTEATVHIEIYLPVKFIKEHRQKLMLNQFFTIEGKEDDEEEAIYYYIKKEDCEYRDEKWIFNNGVVKVVLKKAKKDMKNTY